MKIANSADGDGNYVSGGVISVVARTIDPSGAFFEIVCNTPLWEEALQVELV